MIELEYLYSQLRNHLPPLLKEASTWTLLYSTNQHGISLSTLYRLTSGAGPLLIVIKDEFDDIFGAFVSESLHIQTGFYGDGSCFLWKYTDTSEDNLSVYNATGDNGYLIYSEAHCIAFGGGYPSFFEKNHLITRLEVVDLDSGSTKSFTMVTVSLVLPLAMRGSLLNLILRFRNLKFGHLRFKRLL